MSEGRDLILMISSDNTPTGTPVEVENQGDCTINLGKTVNQTVYKNGQSTNQQDAGSSVSVAVGLTAPVGSGQELLLGLDESGETTYFWLTNTRVGGIEFEGFGKVSIGNLGAAVNGDTQAQVQLGIVGTLTRGAAT